jgi:hypothetical protein
MYGVRYAYGDVRTDMAINVRTCTGSLRTRTPYMARVGEHHRWRGADMARTAERRAADYRSRRQPPRSAGQRRAEVRLPLGSTEMVQ